MWLPDTPRTTVRGFLHRLITSGVPIKMGVHRLSRTDLEFVEKAKVEVPEKMEELVEMLRRPSNQSHFG